jgi:hypothetical protein
MAIIIIIIIIITIIIIIIRHLGKEAVCIPTKTVILLVAPRFVFPLFFATHYGYNRQPHLYYFTYPCL